MATNFYGKDYAPAMPTMDRQIFHRVDGVSSLEWRTLVDLKDAYCAMRFQWEPFKAGAKHPERWGRKYDDVREKIAELMVDAIHEIEARASVRSHEGYGNGGSITAKQSKGASLEDAINEASAEAAEEFGITTKEKALASLKKSAKKKGGAK